MTMASCKLAQEPLQRLLLHGARGRLLHSAVLLHGCRGRSSQWPSVGPSSTGTKCTIRRAVGGVGGGSGGGSPQLGRGVWGEESPIEDCLFPLSPFIRGGASCRASFWPVRPAESAGRTGHGTVAAS
jgi:hypothetical protein